MDLDTKNLIFRLEGARKRAAQLIIDKPELADKGKIGSTIDALSKTIYKLRTGQMNAKEFMESIPEG